MKTPRRLTRSTTWSSISGTLPSGVTSSRSSQTYRAVVRILDDDFSKTVSAREDQPSDWRFGTLAAPADPEMQTLKWWIDGPEAQYFELGTPIIEPPWVFARFYVRSDTMLDRDVKDSYEFFVYYSDGTEQSGDDPDCSETTPSNCRPDYRANDQGQPSPISRKSLSS